MILRCVFDKFLWFSMISYSNGSVLKIGSLHRHNAPIDPWASQSYIPMNIYSPYSGIPCFIILFDKSRNSIAFLSFFFRFSICSTLDVRCLFKTAFRTVLFEGLGTSPYRHRLRRVEICRMSYVRALEKRKSVFWGVARIMVSVRLGDDDAQTPYEITMCD